MDTDDRRPPDDEDRAELADLLGADMVRTLLEGGDARRVEREDWEGNPDRNCGDHRTTGARAWCFDCREWCYPKINCHGCVDFRALLTPILAALTTGTGFPEANRAMEELCLQLGVDHEPLRTQGETPRYCSTYCEHNAEITCHCAPCAFIRTHTGFVHEPGCRLAQKKEGET
jgi:hypothetical protein